jgi:hypothetical protein
MTRMDDSDGRLGWMTRMQMTTRSPPAAVCSARTRARARRRSRLRARARTHARLRALARGRIHVRAPAEAPAEARARTFADAARARARARARALALLTQKHVQAGTPSVTRKHVTRKHVQAGTFSDAAADGGTAARPTGLMGYISDQRISDRHISD